MKDSHLVTERDKLQFQFRAAAKPAGELGEQCPEECEDASDITGRPVKSSDF
jgi:hypothetical protein